jgi:hypothetical protein
MRAIALGGIEPTKEPKKPRKKKRTPKVQHQKISNAEYWSMVTASTYPMSQYSGPVAAGSLVSVAHSCSAEDLPYVEAALPGLGPMTGTISGTWNPTPKWPWSNLLQSNLRKRVEEAKVAYHTAHAKSATRVMLGRQEWKELEDILAHDLGPIAPSIGSMCINVVGLRAVYDAESETRLEVQE